MTAAILGGAEAERQAANENKYAEIRRGSDIPVPGMPGLGQKELGERSADAAEHERQITAEAMKPGLEYQNRVETLDQEIAALEKIRETQGDTLALEISLRDLENQRLKAMVDQSLALRTARDGVRAFFLEMQEEAKSAAQIVYDALNSSLDRVSSNLRSCSRARRQTGPRCSSRPARKWCSPASRASWRRGSGSWASWPASTLDTVSRMEPPEIRLGPIVWSALHAPGIPGLPGAPGAPGEESSGIGAFFRRILGGGVSPIITDRYGPPGGEQLGTLDRAIAGAPGPESAPGPLAGEKPAQGPGILGYLIQTSLGEKSTGLPKGLDGSSPNVAIWVRMASSYGQAAVSAPMGDLIGKPAPESAAAESAPAMAPMPFPGLGPLRIPGLNVDAGGFERGPGAQAAPGAFGSAGIATGLLRFFLPGFPGIQNSSPVLPLDRQIATSPSSAFNPEEQAAMSAIPGVKGAPPPPPPQPPGFIKFLQHVVGIAGAATGAMAPGSGEGIGAIDQNIATAPSSLADVFDFGGWMAEGGDVTPGKFYGWQEDGQEYFAPSVAGRIIPERSMGGGGNTLTTTSTRAAPISEHRTGLRAGSKPRTTPR